MGQKIGLQQPYKDAELKRQKWSYRDLWQATPFMTHKTNDYIRRELRITDILDRIDEYRRNWLSHLQRIPQNRIRLKSYRYRPRGKRTIGRPKKCWREQLWLWRRNGSEGTILDVYGDDDQSVCRVQWYGVCSVFLWWIILDCVWNLYCWLPVSCFWMQTAVSKRDFPIWLSMFNPLTPNDPYRGRTAPLCSKVAFYIFIQQI
jgi:hypothetical protein